MKTKRILAALLAMVMVIGTMGISVFAEEPAVDEVSETQEVTTEAEGADGSTDAPDATTEVSVWDGKTYDTSWYEGQGDGKVYTLTTAAQVAGLIDIVGGKWKYDATDGKDKTGKQLMAKTTIKLGADIDLAGYEWIPLGTGTFDHETNEGENSAFQGIFDGQGHKISNMKITDGNPIFQYRGTRNVGFISALGVNAEVKNVIFENPVMDIGTTYYPIGKRAQVGVVAGSAAQPTSKIDNVTVTGLDWDVEAAAGGGIVGLGYNITNCSVDGDVNVINEVKGGWFGGITGTLRGIKDTIQDFSNNSFNGSISGYIDFAGYLVGLANYDKVGTSSEAVDNSAIIYSGCSSDGSTGLGDGVDFASKEYEVKIVRDDVEIFGLFDLVLSQAQDGDVVNIAAGTYEPMILPVGKQITIRGAVDENGAPAVTILSKDGEKTKVNRQGNFSVAIENIRFERDSEANESGWGALYLQDDDKGESCKTNFVNCEFIKTGVHFDGVASFDGCKFDGKGIGYSAFNYCCPTGDISVKNSTFTGYNFASIHLAEGVCDTLTIENCEITGSEEKPSYIEVGSPINVIVNNSVLGAIMNLYGAKTVTLTDAVVTETGGFNDNIYATAEKDIIVGGKFINDPINYVADGYARVQNDDGTYTIKTADEVIEEELPSVAVTISPAKAELSAVQGSDVVLDENAVTEAAKDGLVDGADAMLVDAVKEYVAENPDTTEIEAYRLDKVEYVDILKDAEYPDDMSKAIVTVEITPYVVIVEDGVETEIEINTEGKATTIRLPLPAGFETGTKINLKHILDDGKKEEFNNVDVKSDDGMSYVDVTTSNGFSTWIISSPENTDTMAAEVAEALKIELVKHVENERVYDIVLKGTDKTGTADKYIYRWTSAEMDFLLTPADNPMSTGEKYDFEYKITPGTNIEYENIDGVDKFNMNGTVASDASGYSIKLGEIEFTGYGKFSFGIATPANAMAQTAVYEETDDSINRTYKKGANLTDKRAGEFLIGDNSDTVDNLLNDVVITETLEEVTIVIENNNKIGNQQVDYQDMTLTIDAKDNNYDKTIRFGETPDITEVDGLPETVKVAYDEDSTYYTVKVMLPVDRRYTFKVEGAGYRTSAKDYTISGEDDAENKVTFWNNAKQVDGTDFLAGEIVKDGKINIYDLSAVVSYFNTKDIKVNAKDNPDTEDVNEASYYRTYDLNRDGKIDTIDISYLLLSWGK